jgi:hypothetical protein
MWKRLFFGVSSLIGLAFWFWFNNPELPIFDHHFSEGLESLIGMISFLYMVGSIICGFLLLFAKPKTSIPSYGIGFVLATMFHAVSGLPFTGLDWGTIIAATMGLSSLSIYCGLRAISPNYFTESARPVSAPKLE